MRFVKLLDASQGLNPVQQAGDAIKVPISYDRNHIDHARGRTQGISIDDHEVRQCTSRYESQIRPVA